MTLEKNSSGNPTPLASYKCGNTKSESFDK